MSGLNLILTLAILCLHTVGGNPIIFRETTDEDTSNENNILDIEISPYVFKEFIKQPKPSVMEFVPLPSEMILEEASHEKYIDSDSEFLFHTQANKNFYNTNVKNVTLHDSTISKPKINGSITNYGDRFLSAVIKANECQKDYTYSLTMKRCVRKFNFGQSTSIVG